MGIQFWIEHSSFSDVVTEVKEIQNRIEVEFKQHLSELEKIKRDVGTNESELKKLRSDYQKLLQDRNEKEKRITDLSQIMQFSHFYVSPMRSCVCYLL